MTTKATETRGPVTHIIDKGTGWRAVTDGAGCWWEGTQFDQLPTQEQVVARQRLSRSEAGRMVLLTLDFQRIFKR
jgi:hypothetical protein